MKRMCGLKKSRERKTGRFSFKEGSQEDKADSLPREGVQTRLSISGLEGFQEKCPGSEWTQGVNFVPRLCFTQAGLVAALSFIGVFGQFGQQLEERIALAIEQSRSGKTRNRRPGAREFR